MRIRQSISLAALAMACVPVMVSASLYSDALTSTNGTGYNVNIGGSANFSISPTDGSSDATFGYDYSAVGVPLDPNFSGNTSTTALRIRAALNSTTNGAVSVSPTGFALPTSGGSFTPFKIQYDVYTNFVTDGNNSTTLSTVGVGTTGTTTQFTFNNTGTVMFANTIDGGTGTSDYRAYANNTFQLFSNSLNANYYGANSVANGTTTAILNNTYSAGSPAVFYYENALGTHSVPAAQTTITPTQTGSSTGTTAYAWHVETVTFTGTDYIWALDGTMMADVPASGVTTAFNGADFFIGGSDTGANGDTEALAQTYNFILVDNLSVTTLPEPASISMLGVGAIGLMRRRRSR